jgi:hypothetical protein
MLHSRPVLGPPATMEQAGLLRLARSISVSSGSVAALSMETSGVQVPVFEMLLAPVKAGLAMPMMMIVSATKSA